MTRKLPEIGSIYEQVGGWRSQWQLDEFVNSPGFPLHVRMSAIGSTKDVRLYGASVLNDQNRFRLIPNSSVGTVQVASSVASLAGSPQT